jgi:putative nucleotidyltransferase with HDIG domain
LHDYELLKHIVPELEEGIGCEQNGDHIYHVWEHNLRALQHAANSEWPFHVKMGALFHDIGKPRTRVWSDEKRDWTFYGHDVVGAKMSVTILRRLKYSSDFVDVVEKLVRNHLFFSDIEKITLSAVRRIVSKMGPENVWDLMKVRACDRIGMGRPKEKPYRLRKYEAMIEEAMRAPVTVGMLKINGNVLMEALHVKPGPRMGWILHALLEEVLDNPSRNSREYLISRVRELEKLDDPELRKLGEAGKDKKEGIDEAEIAEIRKRHWVK